MPAQAPPIALPIRRNLFGEPYSGEWTPSASLQCLHTPSPSHMFDAGVSAAAAPRSAVRPSTGYPPQQRAGHQADQPTQQLCQQCQQCLEQEQQQEQQVETRIRDMQPPQHHVHQAKLRLDTHKRRVQMQGVQHPQVRRPAQASQPQLQQKVQALRQQVPEPVQQPPNRVQLQAQRPEARLGSSGAARLLNPVKFIRTNAQWLSPGWFADPLRAVSKPGLATRLLRSKRPADSENARPTVANACAWAQPAAGRHQHQLRAPARLSLMRRGWSIAAYQSPERPELIRRRGGERQHPVPCGTILTCRGDWC